MEAAHQTMLAEEALGLLQQQLSQPQPCVATASIVLGVLQDRLFLHNVEPLQATVSKYVQRFQELFVAPAAAKLTKCKTPQDKAVAIAKFLRGKLAKAPVHKQPLHTQYLPSALRDSGKRQLDCLGIATAVLAMCHHAAMQWPQQHGDLAEAAMVVSDDHCWLAFPRPAAAAAGAAGAAAEVPAAERKQQYVYVEVTDPAVLTEGQLAGSWLYAGGHGTVCSSSQVLMVLVAGLMPEELQDEAAAKQLREVQLQLLGQLAAAHPAALLYSNFFRWGMLHEEDELLQLAAAAEAAAETGNMNELTSLGLLPAGQLQSQQLYSTSLQRSNSWQWHPCSCAAFGWLNRLQAALCGETDDLLCLAALSKQRTSQQQQTQQQQQAQVQLPGVSLKQWLDIAVFLLQQALSAVQGCTSVLRHYSGCAGKPNKAADTQLLEAIRDLWQNLADANKAVAYLQQMHALHGTQAQPEVELQHQQQQPLEPPAGCVPSPQQQQEHSQQLPSQQSRSSPSGTGHLGHDVPAAAAASGHTVHLAAAITKAAACSRQDQGELHITMTGALEDSSWLRQQLEFVDALLCFFGEESADVPAGIIADFVTVAGLYSGSARALAVEAAVGQQAVFSTRVHGLLGSTTWGNMEPGLQQQLQMPGARSRKRQRKE